MSRERMPGATWLPLPESDSQGSFTKTALIFHSTGTAAGARANQRYFSRPDMKVESTFIVDHDGEIVQIMPASARADANGSANKRAISVEVIGTADQPFTPAQLDSCIRIAVWACGEHPIARRQIPSEGASGIGWHVMFGAPGPWTSARGKQCPGPQRIAQVRDLVIPSLTTTPTKERPTMALDPDVKTYLDQQFAVLSGGPRVRDEAGKIVDRSPVLSVADTYTLVEESEKRTADRVAASEQRILEALRAKA